MRALTRVLEASIEYGLEHREEALKYALGLRPRTGPALTDRFVGMYVNDLTRDYGDRGREPSVDSSPKGGDRSGA